MWEKLLSKKKTLKSLGGKSVHGKKSLRFGMVSDVDQKISLLAGKNLAWGDWFSPIKSSVYFLFCTRRCSNSQNFFRGNPPYANFFKRDSLYFDLLPGPFKSAIIFYHFLRQWKIIKWKNKSYLLVSFIYFRIYNFLLISINAL